MPRTKPRLGVRLVLAIVLIGAIPASFAAQKQGPDVIWQDRGDISALDLFYGAGSKAHAPGPASVFTFVKEDTEATSPKFDVKDDQGVRWKAKLGEEPQSETAATRFLWAAGYFVDEDYYLAEVNVTGLPQLHRGAKFVSTGGIVRRARLERKSKDVKNVGTWSWFDNPFVGKRDLNGLRIMMSLLNNWDVAQTNNSIDEIDGERRYLVSDMGATLGNTGNSFTRSKSVPKDYAASAFIGATTPDFVDFVLHSRPFLLSVVNVPNYLARTKMETVTQHIPRADARWLGQRLSLLSEDQIRDGFRAGGYTHDEVEMYTQAMRKRIAALAAL
jgi:hypothetical protein